MREIGHLAVSEEHVEAAIAGLADDARILISVAFDEMLELGHTSRQYHLLELAGR